jgi:hypothetical protein
VQRNFALGVANGALFRLFAALTDPSLVLTWFVSQLTASPLAIGLLLPISRGGWFLPQLAISGRVQSMHRKMPLYRAMALARGLSLGWIIALIFGVGSRNPSLLLIGFLTLYGVYSVLSGVAGLLFMDIAGKAIPAHRRASFFGSRRFAGSLLALGGSALTSYVLDERRGLAFPANFGWLFAAAALAIGAGFFFFAQITEPLDAVQDGPPRTVGLRHILDMLGRDRNFGLFVAARVVLLTHTVATPFYTVFAKEQLGAPTSMAGAYLTVFTLASVASTLLWGRLGDRRGNRVAMLLSSLLSIPLPLVPLFFGARISYSAFAVLFLWLGIAESGTDISALSLALDVAPRSERVLYIGFLNTVLGIVSLLLVVGGFVVQQWGLSTLFGLSATCAVLSSFLIWALREPRDGALEGRV